MVVACALVCDYEALFLSGLILRFAMWRLPLRSIKHHHARGRYPSFLAPAPGEFFYLIGTRTGGGNLRIFRRRFVLTRHFASAALTCCARTRALFCRQKQQPAPADMLVEWIDRGSTLPSQHACGRKDDRVGSFLFRCIFLLFAHRALPRLHAPSRLFQASSVSIALRANFSMQKLAPQFPRLGTLCFFYVAPDGATMLYQAKACVTVPLLNSHGGIMTFARNSPAILYLPDRVLAFTSAFPRLVTST